jgi:hypothetical protein
MIFSFDNDNFQPDYSKILFDAIESSETEKIRRIPYVVFPPSAFKVQIN